MTLSTEVKISEVKFDGKLFSEIQDLHYAQGLWPLVYLISDDKKKELYVGETTDVLSRMKRHLKDSAKSKLRILRLITSEKFNKSATLDIESNLIQFLSGDGRYKLLNSNIGIANHNYYQKQEVYWSIFEKVWDKLRSEGIARNPLNNISNSDLFKYSPYKSLTREQTEGLNNVILSLLNEEQKTVLVNGGAGSGKTILAIFLFKLMMTENEDFNFKEFRESETELVSNLLRLKKKYPSPKMALIVPMSSFRATLKKVFRNIHGLSADMVLSPFQVVDEDYDIVLVDEAHRLRRRINLGPYFGTFDKTCRKLNLPESTSNELEWILKTTKKQIFFYDVSQSIKPSDVEKEKFLDLKRSRGTMELFLKSQFRVQGGNKYMKYLTDLLEGNIQPKALRYSSKKYEFLLFDSIDDMIAQIKLREKEYGLARLVAGYAWKWVSKKDKSKFDIQIGDTSLKWNSVSGDWINSDNAVSEVGCIHTTQGYDLNYTGVIIGNEVSFDDATGELIIRSDNYHDRNGKATIRDPDELKEFIVNIYKTIMSRGIRGTYVYVCDEKLRHYFSRHVKSYRVKSFGELLPTHKIKPFVTAIPVYEGHEVDKIGQEQTIDSQMWIKMSSRKESLQELFAIRMVGDAMNQVIPTESICLFRKGRPEKLTGRIVLCKHPSIEDPAFPNTYTVLQYRGHKSSTNKQSRTISLQPSSSNQEFKIIKIVEDLFNQFEVVGVFEQILYDS